MLVQLMHRIMQLHLYFAPPSLFKFLWSSLFKAVMRQPFASST
jgi:hypothetical protein